MGTITITTNDSIKNTCLRRARAGFAVGRTGAAIGDGGAAAGAGVGSGLGALDATGGVCGGCCVMGNMPAGRLLFDLSRVIAYTLSDS